MPAKVPTNHSVSWEALAAASPLAVLWALVTNFSPGTLSLIPPPHMLGGYTLLAGSGMGALFMAHNWISSFPTRRLKVAFETCKLYVHKEAGIRLPRLQSKRTKKYDWGWWFYYSLPIGLCKTDFDQEREPIEAALDAEVNFAWEDGYLRIEVATGKIPKIVYYKLPDTLDGEIPFMIGIGRTGPIFADLAKLPHLLVGGTTGSGKSTFLLALVSTVMRLRPEVELHIIDRKQVEFSYLQGKIASMEHTIEGAVKTLEKLHSEMERRKALLANSGKRSVKAYRKAYPEEAGKLPYKVLIIDEYSQISTLLAHDKEEREVRAYCMKMVVDLACIARSLGIHVIVATQYPTAELIHNQLRANLNGRLVFKCEGAVNSEVCLGHGNFKAHKLPVTNETPGRAIWQHTEEREVQTYFLAEGKADELAMEVPRQVQEKEKPMQPGKIRREGIEYD